MRDPGCGRGGARWLQRSAAAWLALAALPGLARAETLYVDATLGEDCPDAYDPGARRCAGGTATAYASLAAAARAAGPGDEVLLREGDYAEPLQPASSGEEGRPIVFRSADGERATLRGIRGVAIRLTGLSHVVLRDLSVDDVTGWGRLEETRFVEVRGCTFTRARASGTTGGLKLVRARFTTIVENRFEDGADDIVLQESDQNLIVGNVFFRGRHSLLSIRCSDRNVVRDNVFENPEQKAVEIYDCEGVSDAPFELDATKRNLLERNRFVGTRASDRPHRYNAIQYAGQEGIVRLNVFHDNLGGGLGIQVYSQEALHNYGHRIYNNSFVANRCYAIMGSDDVAPERYFDVLVLNNVLFDNADCAGDRSRQILIRNTEAVRLLDNVLADEDPGFVDAASRDLRLSERSALRDAARFVARARGAGRGTELVVDDAGYFYDGYGIPGELGDLIQVQGSTERARIVRVDDATDTLHLDRPLSWEDGAGVHLAWFGAAPDVGAFEFGLAEDTGPGGGPDGGVGDSLDGGLDGGSGGASDGDAGGASDGDAGGGSTGPAGDGGRPREDAEAIEAGCACRAGPRTGGSWTGLLTLLFLLARSRRRGAP